MANDTRRPISGKPRCVYTAKYAIVCMWVLIFLSPVGARAQSNSSPPQSNQIPPANFTPSMAVIIVILIAALFLMGFFSIYIRHCSDATGGSNIRALGGIGASLRLRGAASRGLDAEVIETFPTFVYSAVKGLKIGKGALECAVCLNEFEDDETLRLMPKCDHVFHSECIDAWLCSHVTCPVCRANLVPQPGETLHVPDLDPQDTGDRAETEIPQNNDVSIPVAGEHEENALNPKVLDRHKSLLQNRPPRSRSLRGTMFGNFPRSHSTGHSLVNPGENTDRFTLRLPEDVRKQMITRALDRTTSCMVVLPGEGSSRRGFRPGLGGSNRGQNSFKRLDRGLKSDRWGFSLFTRSTSSARYPKVTGDGSTSSKGMRTSVKVPSFRRMEPKGDDEPGLLSPNSAGLPV